MRILSQVGGFGSRCRPAFTLLEMLLATVIAALLMAALYVTVDVQLRHAQAAREVIEHATLARALLARMSNDITSMLAPTPPPPTGRFSGGGGAGGGGGTSGGGSNNSGTSSGGAASSTSNAVASGTTSTNSTAVPINLGVQGDAQRLILSVSKVPRELHVQADVSSTDAAAPVLSDERRISYWLAGGSGQAAGLARQELKLVTSDDALNSMPPDIPDELSYVIAEEVQGLTLRYFDGSAWQDSWDGTAVGSDGVTPLGPPRAIEITLEIALPSSDGRVPRTKTFRHVVAIPTANGAAQTPSTSS